MDAPEDPELTKVLKAHAEYYVAPADLRNKVLAAARQASPAGDPLSFGRRVRSWFALPALRMGLTFATGACVALLGVSLSHLATRDDAMVRELLADHARALMTNSSIEVASRSTHTVKPWLSARLGYSPNVVDLADLGFPLLGGRRSLLGSVPVAVMAYSFGEHEIDLYAVRGDVASHFATRLPERDGYNLRSWQDGDMRYIAVSDVAAARLDEFQRQVQERQANPKD